MNTTIVSLNVLCMFSISPLYSINHYSKDMIRTSIYNSVFSHFFSSVITSHTTNHATLLKGSSFLYSISTPVIFSSQCYIGQSDTYTPNQGIEDKTFSQSNIDPSYGDKRIFFNGGCGNISILSCVFKQCYANKRGGSLSIEQDSYVVLHNTFFSGSYLTDEVYTRGAGASIAIGKNNGELDSNQVDPSDGQISQANVQYCCFSGCYAQKEDTVIGVALFIASKNTILYYSSAVNCFNTDTLARGSQFDIQAENVKSKNVNVTGGNAKYCAAIEFRYAKSGFFKFQTISNIKKCMFGIAFTKINIEGIDISYSNMNDIYFEKPEKEQDSLDNVDTAFIHVREKSITISNFCFSNAKTKYLHPKIISRGGGINPSIVITLINCKIDKSITNDYYDNTITTNNLVEIDEVEENIISQLKLEDCQGEVEYEGTLSLEPVQEYTDVFSNSDEFTESGGFSSSDFTYSNEFTPSFELNRSMFFTKSHVFTESAKFSKSSMFSYSNDFTSSNRFSHSFYFTESETLPQLDQSYLPLNSDEKDKPNLGLYVGAPVGAVAAAAAAALAAFFIRKNRLNALDGQSMEIQSDDNTSTKTSNPLYKADGDAPDDPFAEDFVDN